MHLFGRVKFKCPVCGKRIRHELIWSDRFLGKGSEICKKCGTYMSFGTKDIHGIKDRKYYWLQTGKKAYMLAKNFMYDYEKGLSRRERKMLGLR